MKTRVVVTSDHIDNSFIWKSHAGSQLCVWLKFESAFSACSSPA